MLEIVPARHGDARGFLSETWSRDAWREHGIAADWVQDNHSWSRDAGTLRGLHYQLPPAAQAKLVRVSRGAVFDVAVDVRGSSLTFGHHITRTVSAAGWNQVYIPEGFAHGFLTLEPDTEVQYKVSAPYRPHSERVVRFDDPALGIPWPRRPVIMADRDRDAPALAQADLFA